MKSSQVALMRPRGSPVPRLQSCSLNKARVCYGRWCKASPQKRLFASASAKRPALSIPSSGRGSSRSRLLDLPLPPIDGSPLARRIKFTQCDGRRVTIRAVEPGER
jgi:hypothetical protein